MVALIIRLSEDSCFISLILTSAGFVGAVIDDGPVAPVPSQRCADDPALFAAFSRPERGHFQPTGRRRIAPSAGGLRGRRRRRQFVLAPVGTVPLAASATSRSLGRTSGTGTGRRLSPGSSDAGGAFAAGAQIDGRAAGRRSSVLFQIEFAAAALFAGTLPSGARRSGHLGPTGGPHRPRRRRHSRRTPPLRRKTPPPRRRFPGQQPHPLRTLLYFNAITRQ